MVSIEFVESSVVAGSEGSGVCASWLVCDVPLTCAFWFPAVWTWCGDFNDLSSW